MASYFPSCGTDIASHAIPCMPLHILHIPNCVYEVLARGFLSSFIHRWMCPCSVHLFQAVNSTDSAGLPTIYLIWPGSDIDLSHLSQQHRWTDTHSEHIKPTPHHQLLCKVRNSQRSLQRAGQLSNSMIGAVKVEPTRLVLWIWLSPSVAKVELLTRSVSIYRNVCMWVCMHKDVRQENYLLWRWRRPDQFWFAPLIHQLMKRKVATC